MNQAQHEQHERLRIPEPSWGSVLAQLTQLKVAPPDDPNRPADINDVWCVGRFATPKGEKVLAWGSQETWPKNSTPEIGWAIEITPPAQNFPHVSDTGEASQAPNRSPYQFDVDYDEDVGDYVVVDHNTKLPLSPAAVEALVTTIATCVSTEPTVYTLPLSAGVNL